MNSDSPIDPREALETSLTALLLGELPADQVMFLRDAIARDPELARRYERLKQTIELVQVTAKTPAANTLEIAPALKISQHRREELLQHFKTVALKEFAERRRPKTSWTIPWLVPLSVAALLIAVCSLFLVSQLPTYNSRRILSTHFGEEDALQRLSVSGQRDSGRNIPELAQHQLERKPLDPNALRRTEVPGEKTTIVLPNAGVAPGPATLSYSAANATAVNYDLLTSKDTARLLMEPSNASSITAGSGAGGIGGGLAGPSWAFTPQDPNQGQMAAFRRRYGSDAGKPVAPATEGKILARNEVAMAVDPVTGVPVQVVNPPTVGSAIAPSSIEDQNFPLKLPESVDRAAGGVEASGGGRAKQLSLAPAQESEALLRAGKPTQLTSTPGDLSFSRARVDEPAKQPNQSKLPELVPSPANRSTIVDSTNGDGPQMVLSTNAFGLAQALRDETPTELGRTKKTVDDNLKKKADEKAGLQAKLDSPKLGFVQLDREDKDTKKQNGESKEERLAQLQIETGGYDNDSELPRKRVAPPIPQPEIQTGENAFSTFSLNVSDVSFKLAAAGLEKGAMPDPAGIRVEEFINAFDYRDPEPTAGVPIAFASERAQYPFAQNRDLLRFSLKTAAQGRQVGRPLNLVVLLDNSGSMERADRVRIIQEALRVLASQLQAKDSFSVVTFARTARLWVDGIPGNQAGQVAKEISGLTPQGGTNLEEAMNLAYQTALRHYLTNGVNRVVLLTDGAANLGSVDPETLKQKVETNRKQGIALDCFGIGWEGYNDDLLEVLTRNGDGRYGFINTPEEAASGFANQLAGALHVAAADVKVQVEFNPSRVTAYRQIGYAKHQLTKEQFRDNTVDAAEIGGAESGNGLYVVHVNPSGQGPLATVRVRYKVPGTTEFHEHEWPVPYTGNSIPLQQSSPALRLAGTASAFGEWLATSPYASEVSPDALLGYLNGIPEIYGADQRPKALEWMIRQAKSISGK